MSRPTQAYTAMAAILMLAALPVAAQVVASKVRDDFGGVQEYAFRIFNNTDRAVSVRVDYSFACLDGRGGSDSFWYPRVAARNSAQWSVRPCFGGEEGAKGTANVDALNIHWQLSNDEIEFDAAKAEAAARAEHIRQTEARMAEEARDREERRRRKRCSIDDNGHFELDRVAFGHVPRECLGWFPEMHAAILKYEAAERQRQAENQRRMAEMRRQQELAVQQQEVRAGRAKLEAAQRQDALDRLREKQAAMQAEETARARQERQERDAAENAAQARRAQTDPCGLAADVRARPPQPRPIPPGTTGQARAAMENYNAQLMAQWQQATAAHDRACARAGSARAAPAPVPQGPSPEALAEEARRQQARLAAEADLARVNAEGRESLRKSQAQLEAQQDETAKLRELMNSMK